MPSVIILSVLMLSNYAKCYYTVYHYAVCDYEEWQYTECHYEEWQYA
jgi:hypothetical protein